MDQGVGARSVLGATQAEVHTGLFALRDFCSRYQSQRNCRQSQRQRWAKKRHQRTFFKRVRRDAEKGKGDVAFRTRWEEKENPVALLKMEVPPSEFF